LLGIPYPRASEAGVCRGSDTPTICAEISYPHSKISSDAVAPTYAGRRMIDIDRIRHASFHVISYDEITSDLSKKVTF